MIVGILKEIKTEENRVSMTPAGVEVMKDSGHTVKNFAFTLCSLLYAANEVSCNGLLWS